MAVIGVSVWTGTKVKRYDSDNLIAQNINSFVIKAYANELDAINYVPIDVGSQRTFSLDGNLYTGWVRYHIETNFSCQGDNIDTITYSINKGAFDIVENEGDSIIIDEIAYDETDNFISYGTLLKEYTVKYDAQINDTTVISFVGEKYSLDVLNALWGDEYNGEEVADAYNELLEGVEIMCTVHYKDGRSASQVIIIEGKVVEASLSTEGDVYNNEDNLNTKLAFFVFKLKNAE